jgi:hypothetical protein
LKQAQLRPNPSLSPSIGLLFRRSRWKRSRPSQESCMTRPSFPRVRPRTKLPGTMKDQDSRGIRVRVRNIQIDDTKIIRDIFAVSHIESKSRSSYARFADWYVGEIFLDPKAAIPNARRDGFEENQMWHSIRNELDRLVATHFGKMAYRTSNKDQLSLERLAKRLDELQKGAEPLIATRSPIGTESRKAQRSF